MARMVEVRNELVAILVEQALGMTRELELASDASPMAGSGPSRRPSHSGPAAS